MTNKAPDAASTPPSPPLPGQVKAFGWISLFNDIASEASFPLLPAFITQVLGLSPAVLGVMEGIADTLSSLLKYVAGWLADKSKRKKPLAVAGYALANLIRPLLGFATGAWHLVAIRAVDRVGKGLRTAPRDTLLAAAVAPAERGRAFGFHRAMDHTGATIGPLLALAALNLFAIDLRTLFVLTAIPGAICVALILFAVREAPDAAPVARPVGSVKPDKDADAVAAVVIPEPPRLEAVAAGGKNFRWFIVAMTLFAVGASSDAFLFLYAQEQGVPVAALPLLSVVLHISKGATSTPGGTLSDRIGARRTILAGWVWYALIYAGFIYAGATWQIWVLFALYGLFYGLTEAPAKALTSRLVPKQKWGRGFGVYEMATGLAALPASAVAGWMWHLYGAHAALALGVLFAALAAAVLAFGVVDDAGQA